jgi:hypothetical protein
MKEILPWLLFGLSVMGNLTLGTVIYSTKSDSFMTLVAAAQSIKDSRDDIQDSVAKFNTAMANVELVTAKVGLGIEKLEVSVEKVRSDIGRIEDFLRF